MAANWDPRRFLAPYAEPFVESPATFVKRHVGHVFRHAPPIAPPPEIHA